MLRGRGVARRFGRGVGAGLHLEVGHDARGAPHGVDGEGVARQLEGARRSRRARAPRGSPRAAPRPPAPGASTISRSRSNAAAASSRSPVSQAQLGHVEGVERVAGVGLGHLDGRREGLVVLAERAVHVHQADRGGRVPAHPISRLLEELDPLVALAGLEGGVTQVGQGHLVVGLELEHLLEGRLGLVRPALGGQRVAQVMPRLGIVGPQLGDPAQLLLRVGGPQLESREPATRSSSAIVRRRRTALRRRVARACVVAGLEQRACLVDGRHYSMSTCPMSARGASGPR